MVVRFRKKHDGNSVNKNIFFLYISVMAESQVKSREAKVDFDEDVLEGENAKTPEQNELFDICFNARLVWKHQMLPRKLRG